MTIGQPSDELRLGRRALKGLGGVKLLKDFFTVDGQPSWGPSQPLTHSTASFELVAQTTEWFVLVDPRYPFGSIQFPSLQNEFHLNGHSLIRHITKRVNRSFLGEPGTFALIHLSMFLGETHGKDSLWVLTYASNGISNVPWNGCTPQQAVRSFRSGIGSSYLPFRPAQEM